MKICEKEPVSINVEDRIVKCWLYGEGDVKS